MKKEKKEKKQKIVNKPISNKGNTLRIVIWSMLAFICLGLGGVGVYMRYFTNIKPDVKDPVSTQTPITSYITVTPILLTETDYQIVMNDYTLKNIKINHNETTNSFVIAGEINTTLIGPATINIKFYDLENNEILTYDYDITDTSSSSIFVITINDTEIKEKLFTDVIKYSLEIKSKI